MPYLVLNNGGEKNTSGALNNKQGRAVGHRSSFLTRWWRGRKASRSDR